MFLLSKLKFSAVFLFVCFGPDCFFLCLFWCVFVCRFFFCLPNWWYLYLFNCVCILCVCMCVCSEGWVGGGSVAVYHDKNGFVDILLL